LYKVFATACKSHGLKAWEWFVILLLLAGAVLSWLAAIRNKDSKEPDSKDSSSA
jgi:hypothetical protein